MKQIFVVEDSKFDRAKIKEVLSEAEYKVRYFTEAEKVIERLKNISSDKLPALMIVDIILAGKLSGYHLAQKIKENYKIPVIFLTGYSSNKNVGKELLKGDLFLKKPVDKAELTNNIRILIEKKECDTIIENKINQNIVKNIEQQIWYYKDPYTYKLANQNYTKFFGRKEKDFRNEYIFNLLPPLEAEKVISENIDIFLKKKPLIKEKWYKNSNGENKLLLIKKIPILNTEGNVENIFCQAEDITEQNILENELRRNRDNLQKIIETIPDMIFLINIEGDILDLWAGNESKLIYPKKEAVNKNIKDILAPETYNTYYNKIEELLNVNHAVTFEYCLNFGKKTDYYEAKMIDIESANEDLKIIISVRDVSKRKKSKLKLEKLSREYETILSNVENAIFLISVEKGKFKFQRLNNFHEKATGLKTEDVKGKTPVEVLGEELGQALKMNYRRCLEEKKIITYEEELNLPAGKRIWLTRLTPVINNGEVEKIVGTSLDITENKIKEKEIEFLSFHDEMTEMYNRRYFENEMERLDSSRKLPIAVMIADLDNLKYINDNFGHQQGDNYIKTASEMIKNSIRDEDIAARIGGDEFAIVMPQTDSRAAAKIYQRIKEKENNYLEKTGIINIFSISIGFAVKEDIESSLAEVFKKADQKMYINKEKNKRNQKLNQINK